MKEFIAKHKKALIIGGIVLAAVGIWYWKFRKPAVPILTPVVVDPKKAQAQAILDAYLAKPDGNVTARAEKLKALGYKSVNNVIIPL
jgi:hypothetical protein